VSDVSLSMISARSGRDAGAGEFASAHAPSAPSNYGAPSSVALVGNYVALESSAASGSSSSHYTSPGDAANSQYGELRVEGAPATASEYSELQLHRTDTAAYDHAPGARTANLTYTLPPASPKQYNEE
jgi:hypothetical protein